MTLSYQLTTDLIRSANITYMNMRPYYEHYSVDWDSSKIAEQIASLDNYDIFHNQEIVGAIRLAFDNTSCWIRDLQVIQPYQNQGFGFAAIAECERVAIEKGAKALKLRVFKISPAF